MVTRDASRLDHIHHDGVIAAAHQRHRDGQYAAPQY